LKWEANLTRDACGAEGIRGRYPVTHVTEKLATMKRLPIVLLLLAAAPVGFAQAPTVATVDAQSAARFAQLALACVHQEYPNKIAHVLTSDGDVAPPRELTPAFYGCYDWHSSVHGHWLLARLARTFPDAPFAVPARAALARGLTSANIAREAEYLAARGSFERPYGLAWLLQLAAELRQWEDPVARELSRNLDPLEQVANERLRTWLPKLSHPVRSGEHSQSAFALGLIVDSTQDEALRAIARDAIRRFYLGDTACPLRYEPSGEDFLSPCLAEADAVRRVLPPKDYATWLRKFLPDGVTLRAETVTDPTDGKLAHLDGLNLSRAWMLEGIASGLPANDRRLRAIRAASDAHRDAGLAAVTGEHYEGGHWLGSFAVYLTTRRGIRETALVKSEP
jgi:hypothetical protein